MNVEKIVLLSRQITSAQEKINKLQEELNHIVEFNGAGYMSVSLSSKQRSMCIDFGQTEEGWEDFFLTPLMSYQQERIDAAQTELEALTRLMQAECAGNKVVEEAENKSPWYPNLPGWTWHEWDSSKDSIPTNVGADEIIEVLYTSERESQDWDSVPNTFDFYFTRPEPFMVAYATKNP